MSTKENIPELRFKEFGDKWEGHTLGDLGSVAMNKRIFKHQTSMTGEVPFFKIGTFGKEPDAYISRELFEDYKARYPYPNSGDLLLSASGSIGKVVEYKGEDQYFQDSNIVWLKHDGKIDNSFLKVFYSNAKWSGLEGSTIKRLYNKNILDTEIYTPSECEQAEIGNYFQKLDTLINQHQQKHDKLSNLKKAMLEKMFPKAGESVPEIRFDGFSGDWEEKKLEDISEKVTEKNSARVYSETFTNSAEFGVISQRDYFEKNISNSSNIDGYYVVKPEAFVYNPRISTLAPCGPVNRNGLGRTGIMSPLYTVFVTKNVDTTFLEYFFKTKIWHSFMYLNGDTGARSDRFSIKDAVFFELPVLCPVISEQVKLGEYFKSLDELINRHSQQLTKLKNIKQACLEKMFV